MTSAFIILVQPQLQPDPNEETAALLRVLIHKIDNTTFGDDSPPLPQWSGPPSTIIQVQAMFYASLATSLFSSFLAMLRKQWMARYVSTDMRGSTIERCQNRQRKLDGLIAWYFDYMMESSSQVLQLALLLLGGGLSLYLWEIDRTVGSVVLVVTSFGVIFYTFIVLAGTVSVGCPYQTPTAQIFRYLYYSFRGVLWLTRSALSSSMCVGAFAWWRGRLRRLGCSSGSVIVFFITALLSPILLPILLAVDACLLAIVVVRRSVAVVHRARDWFHNARGWSPQSTILDLRCVSWILRTSSEKSVQLSTLKYLATITALDNSDPALVLLCVDILVGCVSFVGDKVVVTEGLEQLMEVSVLCCLRTLSHLVGEDPIPNVLREVRWRYTRSFPPETKFEGFPSCHSFNILHKVLYPPRQRTWYQPQYLPKSKIQWMDCTPYNTGHAPIANFAQYGYQWEQRGKVPRWTLHFALHHLSQDPLPPPPIVIDCLSIIAIDLGCIVSNPTTLDEVSRLVAGELDGMTRIERLGEVKSKSKAITALFPYAVRLERGGQCGMIDALLGSARASGSTMHPWYAIRPFIPALLNRASPRTVVLMSPYLPWHQELRDENMVAKWAVAASEIPETEEVVQSVVDTLLHIASVDSLRRQIPVDTWEWLNKRPSLPPVCFGRSVGSKRNVVRRVRGLGNTEILKSYFLLAWSEWDIVFDRSGWTEMRASILGDLGGIELGHHRKDLVERLNHVIEQLDRGSGYLQQHKPEIDEDYVQRAKSQYKELKELLLEVDKETTTRTSSRLINIFDSLTPVDMARIPFDIHVRAPPPVSIATACLQRSLRSPALVLDLHVGFTPPGTAVRCLSGLLTPLPALSGSSCCIVSV